MKFLRSITEMKCKCFSDSQAKLLEGSAVIVGVGVE
jgi:hypothetical protein